VTAKDATSIRDALKSAVVQAMKRRDSEALAVYRTALAAIDNAEAVPIGPSNPVGAIELSAVGVGRTEAQRRALTEQDMIDIVLREADERRAAADSMSGLHPAEAQQLRREAGVLQALTDDVRARAEE
jgi:uncharacterized protein YqeY